MKAQNQNSIFDNNLSKLYLFINVTGNFLKKILKYEYFCTFGFDLKLFVLEIWIIKYNMK